MLVDVASRQDVLELRALLERVLATAARPAAAPAGELMTLEEVATYTKFERRTVRKWVTEGRFETSGKGRRVYLPALEYNGLLRFRPADVEAFGLGTGVFEPSKLASAKTQPAAKASRKKVAVPSAEALRVA